MPRIISSDSHIVEPREVFDSLQRRFGDSAPHVEHDEKRGDVIVVPGVSADDGVGQVVPVGRLGIAGRRLDDPETQRMVNGGYATIRPGITDPLERLKDQDLDGVSCEVLYPSLFFRVFGLTNPEMVVAAFRTYNDWLAGYCSAAPDRLLGLALLPMHDPAAARAELERALSLGYRGGCIPCTSPAGMPYHDKAYDPVWAAAQEAGFSLAMHSFTGAQQGGIQASAGPIAAYASAAVIIQTTATELIAGGVAHRFPTLKFVLGEWNTGWIANWLERLDHAFYRARFAAPAEIDLKPSEYWRRQFYATFEDDRWGVLTAEGIGMETLMWASDFPHHDSVWPHSLQVLDEVFAGVDPAVRQATTIDNVANLYRIDLSRLPD